MSIAELELGNGQLAIPSASQCYGSTRIVSFYVGVRIGISTIYKKRGSSLPSQRRR